MGGWSIRCRDDVVVKDRNFKRKRDFTTMFDAVFGSGIETNQVVGVKPESISVRF